MDYYDSFGHIFSVAFEEMDKKVDFYSYSVGSRFSNLLNF